MGGDELLDEDSLLVRFTNVRGAMPANVVAKQSGERFHRRRVQVDRLEPACASRRSDTDWRFVQVDTARMAGLEPCRSCFGSVLEYLAADPDSEVAWRSESAAGGSDVETDGAGDLFEPVPEEEEKPPLAALTDEVKVTSGSQVFHAPTPDGVLCGGTADYRVVDRAAVESHYRPCRDCFELEAEQRDQG